MTTRRGFLGALAAAILAPVAVAKAATQTVSHGGAWVKGRYLRWTNYTATYTSISREEFIAAVRKAVNQAELVEARRGYRRPEYGFYTNYQNHPAVDLVRQTLDDLGPPNFVDISSQLQNVERETKS